MNEAYDFDPNFSLLETPFSSWITTTYDHDLTDIIQQDDFDEPCQRNLIQNSSDTIVNDTDDRQPMINADNIMLDNDSDYELETWNDNSIRYLIFYWSQLKKQFIICPDAKKLWKLISECLIKHGYYFNAQSCFIKWCRLKKYYMYKKLLNSKKKGNKNRINWRYYSEIDMAIKGIPYEIADIKNCKNNVRYNNENENDENVQKKNANNVRKYENVNTTTKCIDKSQWTHKSTRILIWLYSKNIEKFSTANEEEKQVLWQNIAQHFSSIKYNYSVSNCIDKWYDLKTTYKMNKQTALLYGTNQVKWSHFNYMDGIFQKFPEEIPTLDELITISLIDNNELVDIEKEKKDYGNINVVEINENIEEETYPSGSSSNTWTDHAIKCLIELWGHYRQQFQKADRRKKHLLWKEISDLLSQSGHNYSMKECHHKWHLLKAKYIEKKEKYKTLKTDKMKWQYYHNMDMLLGVSPENISWNMVSITRLIDCYDNHKKEFVNAASGKMVMIWKEISAEMFQFGFNYTPRACVNKWRSLTNQYNEYKINNNKNEKDNWVFYNKIESILKEMKTEVMKCELDNGDATVTVMTELQNIKLENKELKERLRTLEGYIKTKEQGFEVLQKQTMEALKKSNKLEMDKLEELFQQFISLSPPIQMHD